MRFVTGDVRRRGDCEAAAQEALDAFGRPGILIDSAATEGDVGDFHYPTDEQWHDVIDTNPTGVFSRTRAALVPTLAQQSGLIPSMASTSGGIGFGRARVLGAVDDETAARVEDKIAKYVMGPDFESSTRRASLRR